MATRPGRFPVHLSGCPAPHFFLDALNAPLSRRRTRTRSLIPSDRDADFPPVPANHGDRVVFPV